VKKPDSLRQFLIANIPELKRDPDSLLVFVEKGHIISTLSPSLAFEYRYQLNIIITDYNAHSDTLIVPILVWVRANQYDLLQGEQNGIQFEAEILNHETADISITLDLSERVLVEMVNGKLVATHLDEPPLPDMTGPTGWGMTAGGVPVDQL
jgi:hypothetical protein